LLKIRCDVFAPKGMERTHSAWSAGPVDPQPSARPRSRPGPDGPLHGPSLHREPRPGPAPPRGKFSVLFPSLICDIHGSNRTFFLNPLQIRGPLFGPDFGSVVSGIMPDSQSGIMPLKVLSNTMVCQQRSRHLFGFLLRFRWRCVIRSRTIMRTRITILKGGVYQHSWWSSHNIDIKCPSLPGTGLIFVAPSKKN